MQKKSLLIVILLLATALLAQTHTYPSTDSNATITGQWTFTMPTTFLQLTGSTSPLAAAPACSASGTYWLAPIGGTVNAWQFCGNGILYNLSSGGGGFTAGGDLSGSSIDQVVVGIQGNPIGSLAVGCLQWTGSAVIWGSCGSSFITSLTTTGTSGPATVSSGVLNIPQYSGGSSFNPASPGPIGGTTPSTVAATTVTAQSVNGLLNPLNFAGSDIGAQINAAAASCTSGSPCNIVIPPNGTLNFATTITYVPNETISCTEEGSGSGAHTVLNYTGSGIAINFNGANTPVLKGCSIQPGNATEAVHVSGYNPKVVDTIFQGGIAGSKVVHVTAAQQAQIVGSSFYGFSGDALYVDNSVDTNIDGNYHYAYYSGGVNHTSRDLVLDTAADGTTINAWKGGNSGLHGFVMQSTLTGSAPANVFAHDLESDCSYGDTWYFDPSLAGSEVLFTAIDSWASGAGQDCTSAHNIINSSANGVHISGGDSIHISGSFRASANDGILLDQATLSGDETADISITDSKIYDNNFANNSTGSGIVASYTLNGLRIQNNTITDTIEIGGNQKYGVVVSGASNTDLIVTGNNLDGNATGPENITYSQGMIVDHNSNGSTLANAVPVYTDGVSQQAGDSASVIRSLVNVHSAATVQTDSVTFPNLTAGQIGQRFFGTGLSNNNSAVETFDNVGAGSSSNSYCLNMYGSAYSLCINAANISWNGVPLNLSLTTTGTSGAATLTSGVLNIPQYSSGSGVSQIIAGTNVTISPSGGTGTVTINSTSTASTAFSAITGSTNTTAAMVVGTGASLATSGTGTIAATSAPYSGLTGTVPTWNQSTTGNAATATSATTATNVAGGLADELLYQTGVGATGFVTGGTGVLYQSSSGSAPIITNAPYVTANANPSDQSSQAANDLFVTRQINLTMGTTGPRSIIP